ncbi:ABC transporter ATP-binding protein [Paenibacillus baekrokdamisoli]|uniref:ABC transporter ATP-binding protein n=1 Tax=Paenibacillus baekrokdamisoli TaxID=1712516 RepID=A0A3G9J9H0_9BACL|nr:ABC transporter ATP-binding protein [Paenibacillus baekrokdamisoli]MBB3070593.1 ATP-binding cassette subfamily B protein [Paenibacillus baekrokdamisoli]BBH19944.1 ABC transporter ATP-binding protein [Paenibacillus baekrokdamisoli]
MKVLLRLMKYLRPSTKWVVLSLSLLILGTLIDLIAPWLLKEVFDNGIAKKNTSVILGLTLALAGIQVIKSFAMFLQGRSQELVGQNVVFTLRKQMYEHLQKLSFSYYDKAKTGQLMSRMTGDIEAVKNFIGFGALNMVGGLLTFIGTIIFMVIMQWQVTLLSMSTIPLLVFILFRFNKKVGPAWGQIREQMGRLTTTLQENISGIRVVKAFAREQAEQVKFEKRNDENFDTNMERAKLEAKAFPMMGFYGGLTFLIMIWLGAYYVAKGQMTLGTFMAFQWYTWGIIWPLNMLGWQINIMQQAIKAAPRVFEVVDTPIDISDPANGGIASAPIKGNVTFEHVSFHFADQDQEKEEGILQDILLDVREGEIIAVLGATGSGKSSLIALMSRFYDVSEGRVLIDGVDVRDYELDGLRRKIGIVPQETFLFSASIRENIAYGVPEATQEQIEWAATKAQIHTYIESMPFGYDTLIGERGVGLSGGQRQRVALARAILMDPPILVLDEATASVDTATESAIHEELLEVMKGRTTFIIAQRLSSVKRADRIIVLDQGKVVQQGTHKELFEQDGFFRNLFEMQEAASVG